MKEKTSKFKEYDLVRVLPNIKDPDFMTNIGGWIGRVEEIELSENETWLYKIRWDDETIRRAGNAYIDKCEDENLDYEVTYLEEKELELINSTLSYFIPAPLESVWREIPWPFASDNAAYR